MSQLLVNKLSAVRRKRAMITALTAATAAVGGVVLLIGLTMLLDWYFELPRYVRAAMLAIELAIVAYVVIARIVWPIIHGPDDEDLALAVESETPDLRSRLISVIQLMRPDAVATSGMSTSMVGALIRETEQMAQPMDFTRVVKIERLAQIGTVAAVIIVGFGAAVAATAPSSITLAQRAMLMNVAVPRKTIAECLSGNIYVARGEAVTLTGKASGLVIPSEGAVRLDYATGGSQTFDMTRDEGSKDHYSRVIENIQGDFTYTILLGDGHSDEFKVTAAIRPAVSNVDCQQKYPDYTKAGTVKRQTGDLSLLAGSRLMLNITANKRLKITKTGEKETNHLHLHGSELDLPLTVNTTDPTKLTVQDAGQPGMPLPAGTTGFSVHLVDEQGVPSKNPAIYPITIVPDNAPKITISNPKRNEELVTAQATIEIDFDASDDYGVAAMNLRYRVVDAEGKTSSATGDGLAGTYFKGNDFAKKEMDRVDGLINFGWGAKNPINAALGTANASVRWTGQLQAPVSGEFTFFLVTPSSGAKIWFDGEPIVDENGAPKPVTLRAFQRYDVKIEYAKKSTLVPIEFQWQGPGILRQTVPKEVLFSVPLADKNSLVASNGMAEKIIPLNVATNKSIRGYYPWKISEIASGLPLGSVIQWRLEARDTNDVTGPGITYSEPLRQLRLVSDSDKKNELMQKMGEQLTDIEKIKEGQTENSSRAGRLVTGTPQNPSLDLPPDQKPPK